MKKVELTINGKAFPCRPTMGAMLRFKRETGREVTQIDASSFTDLCTYLWCCVVSACKHDGIKFNMALLDFADCITPEDMTEWSDSVTSDAEPSAEGAEKKTL